MVCGGPFNRHGLGDIFVSVCGSPHSCNLGRADEDNKEVDYLKSSSLFKSSPFSLAIFFSTTSSKIELSISPTLGLGFKLSLPITSLPSIFKSLTAKGSF